MLENKEKLPDHLHSKQDGQLVRATSEMNQPPMVQYEDLAKNRRERPIRQI